MARCRHRSPSSPSRSASAFGGRASTSILVSLRGYARDAVRQYSEQALGGSTPLLDDEHAATQQVVATLTGYGALQPLLDDETIEELWINSPHEVFIGAKRSP